MGVFRPSSMLINPFWFFQNVEQSMWSSFVEAQNLCRSSLSFYSWLARKFLPGPHWAFFSIIIENVIHSRKIIIIIPLLFAFSVILKPLLPIKMPHRISSSIGISLKLCHVHESAMETLGLLWEENVLAKKNDCTVWWHIYSFEVHLPLRSGRLQPSQEELW